MRLALTLAHRCRGLLFHREFLARQLTLFDRWLVVLGPTSEPAPPDDGSALILQDVARRYSGRVLVEEAPAGWGSPLAAVRAILANYRRELEAPAFLYLVPPGEIWELEQLRAAEDELTCRRLQAAEVAFDCYLTEELLVRGGWEAAPAARLWRWDGVLPSRYLPLTFPGYRAPLPLTVRPERHLLHETEQVRAYAAQHGPADLLERWLRLQAADPAIFPRPLTDLLGPSGRIFTDVTIHHHDQAPPIP